MAGKKKNKQKDSIHQELEGLEIHINELGEVTSNFDIATINRFLDRHTTDKKRPDQPKPKESDKGKI
jgi:hypothetical protein